MKIMNGIRADEISDDSVNRVYSSRDKRKKKKHIKNETSNNKLTNIKPKKVSLLQLFRFAEKWDILLMTVGLICCCVHGCAMPAMIIVFGSMTSSFANYTATQGNISDEMKEIMTDKFMESIRDKAIYFAIIGAVVLVVGYVQVTTFLISSYRQTFKMRNHLFSSALHQEIGWFDTNDSGELSTRFSEDVNLMQEGLGDKMGILFQWITTFVVGTTVGFVYSWKLTLVVLAFSPLLVAAGAMMTYLITLTTKKELDVYARAGAIAEEVFTSIRTVVAFGGQEKEFKRYDTHLGDASKFGVKKGMFTGAGIGIFFCVRFSSYALAFWYGGKLAIRNEIFIGELLTVFFCTLIAAVVLGNAGPNAQSIGSAAGAAYKLWSIIDRKSKIDMRNPYGKQLDSIEGNIEFKDIHFHFPAREELKILKGLNMKIIKGQTAAVVGASGCGKSTVIQLLQRFYDPIEGSVLIDGTDIKELNVKWLRQHIGIVSQEPILFATSIAENISYGCDGVTQEQIESAAKEANAHEFISKLPNKYDTLVGERGAQLSGGQKQRIAIARALVKNPKIILLDEATSALDTESESTVQAALDKVQSGRTTIVVAHRLSTIKNADVIFGIKDGVVHESGSHEELMNLGGIYYQLVTNQQMQVEKNESDDEEYEEGDGLTDIPLNNFERKPSIKCQIEELEQDETEVSKDKKEKDVSVFRVFKYNKPEWYIIFIGCIAAVVQGGVQPSFAIIFAKFLGIFRAREDLASRENEIITYSCIFIAIGITACVSTFLQTTMFAISGERLTKRIRRLVFKNLLRQNISFFDDPKNGVGALTLRLATDASAVRGATGVRLGLAFQSVAGVGVGITIGFVYSWQLTLLAIACIPLIMATAMLQVRVTKGFSRKNQSALEESGKIASETLSNIRTVVALTKEEMFYNDYCRALYLPHKSNLKRAHFYGLSYSFSQSLIFFIYASIFMFGAYLIKIEQLDYESMFTVFGSIIFAATALGHASQFAPDYAKAKSSINRIFVLIDNAPSIDIYSKEGLKPKSCVGLIQFENATFAYPARKKVKVLKKLNFVVQPGMTVALVGSSGCGKSTTIQLLERFYDVLSGNITLDGNDLKSLNVAWLRAQMGLVSQEPILFDCSIKENIAYGDNSRQVEMNEIIQAARMANISNFIDTLPQGYETSVGDKGTQLSGGQKQRIAIARALVRNPKILLLDEATSALDTESEKIVQEALDRAQEGRTSIVIAHRLSTIQNADCIFVFNNGVISEFGTHSELFARKGIYYKLNVAQGQST